MVSETEEQVLGLVQPALRGHLQAQQAHHRVGQVLDQPVLLRGPDLQGEREVEPQQAHHRADLELHLQEVVAVPEQVVPDQQEHLQEAARAVELQPEHRRADLVLHLQGVVEVPEQVVPDQPGRQARLQEPDLTVMAGAVVAQHLQEVLQQARLRGQPGHLQEAPVQHLQGRVLVHLPAAALQ